MKLNCSDWSDGPSFRSAIAMFVAITVSLFSRSSLTIFWCLSIIFWFSFNHTLISEMFDKSEVKIIEKQTHIINYFKNENYAAIYEIDKYIGSNVKIILKELCSKYFDVQANMISEYNTTNLRVPISSFASQLWDLSTCLRSEFFAESTAMTHYPFLLWTWKQFAFILYWL